MTTSPLDFSAPGSSSWEPSADPLCERVESSVECYDPANSEYLGSVEAMGFDAVVACVDTAREAQKAWGKTTWAERRTVFRSLLCEILERQEEICRQAVRDSGKTMVDAALGEIFPVCEKIRYTLRYGERDLRPEKRRSGFLLHKSARVEYSPLGVIGIIAPWNFPFHNLFCPMTPALFAGNAVVLKVSEWASHSVAYYSDLIHGVLKQHGHSPDLVQFVTGYGDTGAALVRSGVNKVFFTGSAATGRKVMANAARDLVPVVLELGGKDPMIVCEDANLDHALDQAMLGVFTACGQMCVGAERLYVHDSIYDEFVKKAEGKVRSLRQGAPLGMGTYGSVDVGAMTMPGQLDIITELLEDAFSKGAKALVGGAPATELQGQFMQPTLLVNVDHSMRITQEEQFAPIMVVIRVKDDDEAVRLANDCPYGLGSSVFTRSPERGRNISKQLRAGMTVVNDYGIAYMIQSLPFGGEKHSGIGRINGREGLRACCQIKAFVEDRIPTGRGVSVYPVHDRTYGLIEKTVFFLYSQSLLRKLRAAVGMLGDIWRIFRDRRKSS